MPKFICTGKVTLNGVIFYIEAKDETEATKKAAAGDWVDYETSGAETVDWECNPSTVEATE